MLAEWDGLRGATAWPASAPRYGGSARSGTVLWFRRVAYCRTIGL